MKGTSFCAACRRKNRFSCGLFCQIGVFMARVGQFERDETRNSEAFALRRSSVSFFDAEIQANPLNVTGVTNLLKSVNLFSQLKEQFEKLNQRIS